jgi:pimeloyl-ACP methyl ester carboxylesterase
MSAAAPRGKAIIIEGHRHMVNLTAPDLVNDILKDWLAELVAAD